MAFAGSTLFGEPPDRVIGRLSQRLEWILACFSEGVMRNVNGELRFGALAREVFSWDAAIGWIALDNPGRRPLLEWRDPEAAAAATPAQPVAVDPLLLMLAGSRDDIYQRAGSTDPHRLRFVVLAYCNRSQIVMRFGRYGQINIGVGLSCDAYQVGLRLTRLLDSIQHSPVTERQRQSVALCPAS